MEANAEIKKAREIKHKLILTKDVQLLIYGNNLFGRFNKKLAVKITKIVGSMWCAYIFAIIACISLPAAIKSHDPLIIIAWIAQTFLQLVLLPIIIVGQNVQAEASDERALHDHDTLKAIHILANEIYKINEQQTKILDLLEKKNK
jgi:hypothetical protein